MKLKLLCTFFLSSTALAAASASALLTNGRNLLQQGRLEPARKAITAAIGHHKQVIALDPNHALAFIGMGIASLHGGDQAMPGALYEEAIRLEPRRRGQLAAVLAKLDEGGSAARQASTP